MRMRLNRLAIWAFAAAMVTLPAKAEDVRAFFFGNSLINHVSGSDETTVPHWLSALAEAGGHGFAADGVFGDLPGFARNLPPEANWTFANTRSILAERGIGFRRAGFDTFVLNPRNFVQDQSPDMPFWGDNPEQYTAITASTRLFDWTDFQAPNARYFIYEGWADMAPFLRSFPPNDRRLTRYHQFNMGAYHDWYVDYHRMVSEVRPNLDITLIPVASVLAQLLTETRLSEIDVTDLYSDDAPHGTETLYFLASLVTYSAIFNEIPPVMELPQTIHPLVSEIYPEITALIWTRARGGAMDAPTAPPPVTGLTDPALAMGLTGISDWSTQMPFIDLMKSARPWIGHLPDQWGGFDSERLELGGYLDDDGWPQTMPEGVLALETFVLTDLPETASASAGRYRVTWEGQGDLQLIGRAESVDMLDGTAWFTFTPGEGPVALRIEALDAENPIRNITIIRDDHLDLHELGEVFNPDWIRHVQNLRAVRFMDWMDTNNSLQIIWDDRPRPSDYTFIRRGVPVEIMVQLANQIGADPWFTMPHMADDTYNQNFAQYVEARLAPDLRAYVEFSNEVWNFLFQQAHWAAAQAAALWDGAEGDAWMQFAGLRAAQVMDIWSDVFEGQSDRLIRVVGTQGSWPGLEEALLTAPLAVADGLAAPVDSFDAYAIAGYFGYELGTEDYAPDILEWIEEGVANEQIARSLQNGSLAELVDESFPYHARVAAEHGLDLVMYEGGTHILGHGEFLENETLTRAFVNFNYSPEIAEIYADLLTGWRAAGGTLFNGFVDVSAPSQWGSWGALRHLNDSNPRWATLEAYNATAGGDWEDRSNTAFSHGIYVWGSSSEDDLHGSQERDIFLAGLGDDVLHLGPGDRAHGGAGRDRAVLPGRAADYALVEEGEFVILNGPGAPIRMLSVEIAEFSEEPGALYALGGA